MPKRRYLTLTQEQRAELSHIRDRDPRPYLREKAAALLKVADGLSPHHVARAGLLKARAPNTLYAWINDFEEQGVLRPQPARRRRFSPHRPGKKGTAGDAAPAAGDGRALEAGNASGADARYPEHQRCVPAFEKMAHHQKTGAAPPHQS